VDFGKETSAKGHFASSQTGVRRATPDPGAVHEISKRWNAGPSVIKPCTIVARFASQLTLNINVAGMSMISANGILAALGVFTLSLDIYAVRKVFLSPYYSAGQRYAQAAIIVCLPIAGAYVTIYLARADVPMFQSPPVDSFANIEVYSDYSHHHDGTADGSDH
jgi:hypothetical protein